MVFEDERSILKAMMLRLRLSKNAEIMGHSKTGIRDWKAS
jgi:hypothetical protein